MFYTTPSSVGSGHAFSLAGTGIYAADLCLGFSGGNGPTFDKETGATGTGSLAKPGALTPTNNDALLVSVICDSVVGGGRVIDSGFTIAEQVAYGPGNNYGGAIAYKILSGAPASNDPEWSGIGTGWAATLLVFNLGAGGGGGALPFITRVEGQRMRQQFARTCQRHGHDIRAFGRAA